MPPLRIVALVIALSCHATFALAQPQKPSPEALAAAKELVTTMRDRKSTRLNYSHRT